MNKTYRLIWSRTREMWMAVSEKVATGWFRRPLVIGAFVLSSLLAASGTARALDPGALPTGGQVVAGQGTIAQAGSSMTVSQYTDRMIANWSTFNIGPSASVAFLQPGASSVALNRILDQNPSRIFGNLTANGQIFLVNPSGVYFGPTAQVDVGGLVTSSLNLSNENFLSGKYLFENNGMAGPIINQGQIRTASGGYVAFLSPQITNEGTISTPGGTTALAAGEKVSLDFAGDRLVSFTVDRGAVDALVENKGLIKADGGLVMLTARAADELTQAVVNQEGVIEATGIREQGGRIVLDAEGGMATVSGVLDASSAEGSGGRIVATGDRVLVKDGAHLNASGAAGGGEVLVGGSWQNSDVSVRQAIGTVVEAGARLEADATDNGDGGTVVAWSDITNPLSVTRAYGTFEATGGPNGGNGGRIETSGHWLDSAGAVANASAPNGNAGIWLLDPYNVVIGAAAGGTPYANPFVPGTDSTILASDIATSLQGGTSVTITTGTAGGSIGDITVSTAINKASGDSDVTLTLQAANSIVVDQAISNTGGDGKLHVLLDADNNNGARDGGGIVILNNDIATGGGNLSFGTGATLLLNGVVTLVGGDVYVAGAGARSIATGGGNLAVNGEMIIANTSGLGITTGNGSVTFGGMVNSGNTYAGVGFAGKTWSEALANAASGSGLNAGDTYLATITTRLENALASRANSYNQGWLGGRRVTGIGSDLTWRWVTGPESAMDGGKGLAFFTQNTQSGLVTDAQNGTPVGGAYNNWNDGEPNNWDGVSAPAQDNTEYESILQFTGTLGKWNDLPGGPLVPVAAHTLNTYVKETNLAPSPLTIDAGSGNVTFSGMVGGSKALASLSVTSTGTIAINGGGVTTAGSGTGTQVYNGNVTLGSADTTLTMNDTATAFTLPAGLGITNATGADATLTIKTTAAIILGAGSSIGSGTGKLNTVLWADSDADGGYIMINKNSSIATNGGHLWMGGGSGSTTWNGLVVGDGRATGNATVYEGIYIDRGTLTTDGGDVALYGKSHSAASVGAGNYSTGIAMGGATGDTAGSASIDAGTGGILIDGYSQAAAGGANGVELAYYGTATTVQSTSGNITIKGESESGRGMTFQNNVTVAATGGGTVTLEGTAKSGDQYGISMNGANARTFADSGLIRMTATGSGSAEDMRLWGPVGSATGGLVESSTSNIEINANSLAAFDAGTTFKSSGILTIQPRTASTTIGVAGGAGTLQLPAGYFSSNFTDGFSAITIGSATAGDITVGNSALTYNDPLTLKTAGSIVVNSGAGLTGAAGQTAHLILNADADANGGGITVNSGVTVNTNGGAIVMGGGTCTAAGCTNAAKGNGAVGTGGIDLIGANGSPITLQSAGGAIRIWGEGPNTGGSGVRIGYTGIDSGASGSIWLRGDGFYTITVNGNGNGLAVYNESTIRGGSGGMTLIGNGSVNDPANAQWSTALYLVNSSSAYTTDGGILSASATIGQGNGTQNNYMYFDTTSGLGGALQNGDIQIAYSGTSTRPVYLPNVVLPAGNLNVASHRGIAAGNTQTVAGTTTLNGGGAGFDIDLASAGIFNTGTLTVSNVRNISIADPDTLNLGTVTAGGTVGIATLTGDLTVSENITTTDASAAAIVLNAGKDTAAGTATGGNIVISGSPVITTGAGGRATLFTGSVSGSTGLTALAGSGSGRFRYNSDEAATHYTAPLGAGLYAIYREQPLVTVTPDGKTVTYGTAPVFTYGTSGLVNGDASAGISGTATWDVGGATSTSGRHITGSHDISYSGGLASSLGYGFVNDAASTDELTVNQKAITATGITAASRVYDATTAATIDASGAALTNGAAAADDNKYYTGDAVVLDTTGATGSFADKNAGLAKAVTVSGLALSGADAGNYSVSDASGATADITPAPLTVTANDDSRTYTGVPYSGGNGVTFAGFVGGETSTVLDGMLGYGGPSQGAVDAGTYGIDPFGLTSANYAILYVNGILTITGTPARSPSNDPGVEAASSSLTSSQDSVNGTGQGESGSPGSPGTPSLGPGAGSTSLAAAGVQTLVTIRTGGSAVLSTSAFSSPVTFGADGQTTTLTVTGADGSGPMTEVGTLPVFTRTGNTPPVLQGNFLVRESGTALSLTPAGSAAAAPPATDIAAGRSAPFTLTLENGMTLQMTVTVTPDGVLVVSAPDAAGAIDIRQAILMGAMVARKALQVEPGSLSAALFVRI